MQIVPQCNDFYKLQNIIAVMSFSFAVDLHSNSVMHARIEKNFAWAEGSFYLSNDKLTTEFFVVFKGCRKLITIV